MEFTALVDARATLAHLLRVHRQHQAHHRLVRSAYDRLTRVLRHRLDERERDRFLVDDDDGGDHDGQHAARRQRQRQPPPSDTPSPPFRLPSCWRIERVSTKSSPPALLERLLSSAAQPHPFADRPELARRYDGPGRACYALMHRELPADRPVAVVESATLSAVPSSVDDLERLAVCRADADADADGGSVLTFYSIVAVERGLRGLGAGQTLLKGVLNDIGRGRRRRRRDAYTLSPMPGLRRWAERRGCDVAELDARIIAREYLQRHDPVARFHLGNGARVHRVLPAADTSARRLAESGGFMVNYYYSAPSIS